jgi:ABC-type multidrug transport system permease subunit
MSATAFLAMVRKDLQLFFSDRRSVIVSFAVPIFIGAFIGSLTNDMGNSSRPMRVKVAIADLDNSDISKAVIASAQGDSNLTITVATAEEAREQVRKGSIVAAVIIPKDFGEKAGNAFFRGADVKKPELAVLFDPSRAMEAGMVRGVLAQHVMQSVAQSVFSPGSASNFAQRGLEQIERSDMNPDQKRLLRDMLTSVQRFYNQNGSSATQRPSAGLFSMPYTVHEEEVTSGQRIPYNGYAHAFAGMGIQFLLFAALNLGIEMLLERQRGMWKRLRSAPISRYTLLAARATSATIVSLMTLLVSFGFAMLVFKVRIQGSVLGFALVAISCSTMAATFGLLVAAVGNTPGTARGVSTLVVLVMVMVGGAWVPTFVFPEWMQRLTVVVPVRWAVDGLDATTWRGLPLSSAIAPTLALLGFTVLFGLITVTRFRWEEA